MIRISGDTNSFYKVIASRYRGWFSFPIIFIIIIVSIIATPIAKAESCADYEVIGLSYRSNSTLVLGIDEDSRLCYPSIVWYIYAQGNVTIFEDGNRTFEGIADGLLKVDRDMEEGHHNIQIVSGNRSASFSLRITDRDLTENTTTTGGGFDIEWSNNQLRIYGLRIHGITIASAFLSSPIVFKFVARQKRKEEVTLI